MAESSNYREILIQTIPLNDKTYSLTYQMGDMGAMSDLVPKPIVYFPGKGTYLVDPGPTNKPFFVMISERGKIVFKISLVDELKISDLSQFNISNLSVLPDGTAILLYAITYLYDAKLGIEKYMNYEIAKINAKGAITDKINIDDKVINITKSYFLNDGRSWIYASIENNYYWIQLSQNGKSQHTKMASSFVYALQDGSLFVIDDNDAVSLYITDGTDKAINKTLDEYSYFVPGSGDFFGIYTEFTDDAADSKTGSSKIHRVIQMISYSPKYHEISFLAKHKIPSTIAIPVEKSSEALKYFKEYKIERARFDDEGNLYMVARRGPTNPAFEIYKIPFGKELLKGLSK